MDMKEQNTLRPDAAPGGVGNSDSRNSEEKWGVMETGREKGSITLVPLLLLLFLLAGVGGGYFLLNMPFDEGISHPQPTALRQSIYPSPAAAEGKEPAPSSAKRPDPKPIPVTAAVVEEPPLPSVPPALYALQTEPLSDPRLEKAERRIRELGFETSRIAVPRRTTLTRLRIGLFSPQEGATRLAELSSTVPGAFALKREHQVALYAGSYSDLDKARSFADRLFEQGIRVEEEEAEIVLTLHRLRFGAFDTEDSALRMGTRLAASGIRAEPFRLTEDLAE